MNFYNTISLEGEELSDALVQCKKQSEAVLAIFNAKKRAMTPLEVHYIYCHYHPPCPVTSIRRAITNLANDWLLVKTDEMKLEKYGKPNYKWKII